MQAGCGCVARVGAGRGQSQVRKRYAGRKRREETVFKGGHAQRLAGGGLRAASRLLRSGKTTATICQRRATESRDGDGPITVRYKARSTIGGEKIADALGR